MRITSRDNSRLKAARKARSGKDRSVMFIEGARLVEEALSSNIELSDCFYSSSFGERKPALAARLPGSVTYELSDRLFESIADTTTSQGVAALARVPDSKPFVAEARSRLPYLLVSRLNNPSNLGAILRTAAGAGSPGVLATSGSAWPFSAKALRASMGAAFRLPIWTGLSFSEGINWAKENDLQTVGTDSKSGKSYTECNLVGRKLLVLGPEADGLSLEELEMLDEVVRIPLSTEVESLNVAVACGVLLFEAARQDTSRSVGS